MLHLADIRKTYTTGGFTQAALDGVTITFRDSEFVAVLGPSGSGKTTLLNIVGGLDHYDSGDLQIDQISTKEYTDRDWDTYRNNRIGFVFQSYNLIPHQTVLSNVELALTLSGVDKAERVARAKEALDKVGLTDHINKLPNQLSGGQMQRVAIARALINDPEILLADEPTGALDSKTSVAVMNLLKGIAADRLVVMVTHNPDLANEYANRIVSLRDGQVVDDTRPFTEPTGAREAKAARRASMSFFTAIALSFTNLMTKKGRTLMTSFAGSIGIIGIALILALANGVNAYIRGVEENTLSLYPLQIMSQGFDLSSMLAGATGNFTQDRSEDAQVHELKMVANMFERIGANDLGALKTYLDSDESNIDNYVNAIEYSYAVTPQIFASDSTKVRQVNPNNAFASVMGFGSSGSSSTMRSMGVSTDVFASLPEDFDLVDGQYDTVAGRWPEAYNEIMVVLTESGGIADFSLYAMGLRDPAELDEMMANLAANKPVTSPTDQMTFTYDQLLDVTFTLLMSSDYYQWDSTYSAWTDMRQDEKYMKSLLAHGTQMHVVGIVKPREDADATMLSPGLYYPASLVHHIMDVTENAPVVKDQLARPTMDVFTGKTFAEETKNPGLADFDFASMLEIDQSAIQDLFKLDMSGFSPSLSLDLGSAMTNLPELPAPDLASILTNLNIQVDQDALWAVLADTLAAYLSDVYGVNPGDIPTELPTSLPTQLPTQLPTDLPTSLPTDLPTSLPTDLPTSLPTSLPTELPTSLPTSLPTELPTDLPTAWPDIDFPTPTEIVDSFSAWLSQPAVQAQLAARLGTAFNSQEIQTQLANALASYMRSTMTTMLTAMMGSMQSQIELAMRATASQLTTYMSSAMQIDPQSFQRAFKFTMDQDKLQGLLMSLLSTSTHTQDANLSALGYADPDIPSGISIYPKDFAAKQSVLDILNAYNTRMNDSGQDDKVITYTDIVGTLMTSVTDIIDKISAVLVAFVSISLVVSSIMIGIITYISVLERKKEIGILRALGASKRDIGNVFNAETLIVGFVAGLMGVLITLGLTLIANPIVEDLTDVHRIARLPLNAGVILILVSCALTFLAGLIPSSAASRKDPVEALRSE
ncbi:MAG: ATP-binding cassette domain-containing protein [Propionibacteriaceae bacterium]|jgi:ABC-type lipoprotein export system ATPase subunit|nr:ATP-binding cassette domain-containing protein [Propionibacteriaceae bacterium]